MKQYWPSKQGTLLNKEVAYLLNKIYLKLNHCLYNHTNIILSFDIINLAAKQKLLKIVILELEILILDIIDLDLTPLDIQTLSSKLFIDLINKSINSFCTDNNYRLYYLKHHYNFFYNHFFIDKHTLLEEILNYLVFGQYLNNHSDNYYINSQIPHKYIEILLDNFVIQLGHIIFYQFILKHKSLSALLTFLKSNKIHNDKYISIKSIINFKNNLIWQQLIYYYLIKPQSMYNNYYRVWFFNTQGFQYKFIYMYRDQDIKNLSAIHIITISILELQDFLYPKIYKLISLLFQTLTYLFAYFFEKIFHLLSLKLLQVLQIK